MIWFWLILAAIMLVAELATTALVSLWFVAGALAGALCAGLQLPVLVQVLVFALVSALLFATCRTWLVQHFKTTRLPGNTERLIGMEGVVSVPIVPPESGRVQVAGQDWKAISEDGDALPEGTKVRILAIQGVRLSVVRAPETQLLRARGH